MAVYFINNQPYTDELYHFGRKGMKWYKNIFGEDDESNTQKPKTSGFDKVPGGSIIKDIATSSTGRSLVNYFAGKALESEQAKRDRESGKTGLLEDNARRMYGNQALQYQKRSVIDSPDPVYAAQYERDTRINTVDNNRKLAELGKKQREEKNQNGIEKTEKKDKNIVEDIYNKVDLAVKTKKAADAGKEYIQDWIGFINNVKENNKNNKKKGPYEDNLAYQLAKPLVPKIINAVNDGKKTVNDASKAIADTVAPNRGNTDQSKAKSKDASVVTADSIVNSVGKLLGAKDDLNVVSKAKNAYNGYKLASQFMSKKQMAKVAVNSLLKNVNLASVLKGKNAVSAVLKTLR